MAGLSACFLSCTPHDAQLRALARLDPWLSAVLQSSTLTLTIASLAVCMFT